jgi:Ribbon-helix-helix protein, copG family
MGKSIKVKQKRPGRPATGKNPLVAARMGPQLTAEIDVWAAKNGVKRSEAMRRLLAKALKAKP